MTDNEIIETLEICKTHECDTCPLADEIDDICALNNSIVLDLINRQRTEIVELQKRIVFWSNYMDYKPDKIKAKAIKEFAEKIKQVLELNDLEEYNYVCKLLDSLAKEMGASNDCSIIRYI